jgi:hypothetical protein
MNRKPSGGAEPITITMTADHWQTKENAEFLRQLGFFTAWSQWLLELVILRLLGYTGNYRNRTRLTDFDPIERVPWT